MLMPSRCARRILAESSTVRILASVPTSPRARGPIGTDAAGVGPFYSPIPARGVGPLCAPVTRTPPLWARGPSEQPPRSPLLHLPSVPPPYPTHLATTWVAHFWLRKWLTSWLR